jgi:hypothetical protein
MTTNQVVRLYTDAINYARPTRAAIAGGVDRSLLVLKCWSSLAQGNERSSEHLTARLIVGDHLERSNYY